MDALLQPVIYLLAGFFFIGWVGCLITIPIIAFKFVSVLAERDTQEEDQRS